jgi:hypothetical protein
MTRPGDNRRHDKAIRREMLKEALRTWAAPVVVVAAIFLFVAGLARIWPPSFNATGNPPGFDDSWECRRAPKGPICWKKPTPDALTPP